MPDNVSARNWFDHGGPAYARFRPAYPPELAAFLASLTAERRMAVDVGCGNGQLTELLAQHFNTVIGLDPSADQIANAPPNARITYRCAPAEHLPLADGGTNLITAAQAAHWFALPAFYREARRIAAPHGVLALLSYGTLHLEAGLDERFQRFYRDEIGRWWPPERKLVDAGYATIAFPFEELAAPSFTIRAHWPLGAFLGYLGTWSAVRRAREAGQEEVLLAFSRDMAAAWGAENSRPVFWPINMRVGRL